jgi:electron transfer flavoprotein alpha subunit
MENKNVFVYCEINEEGNVADVSLELLTKGRKLADELSTNLEAMVIGHKLDKIEQMVEGYGINKLYVVDHKELFPYRTMPHSAILSGHLDKNRPEIVLIGATPVGRDLAPRIASKLLCGLTADCTSLEIGDHYDKKSDTEYKNLLYQIRPAFGGNIVATIINPETRPQMATVREGVMKQEKLKKAPEMKVEKIDAGKFLSDSDLSISIVERHIEAQKINIKNQQILVAGGYGVGSKENFALLHELAEVLGGDVAASRAAVDAGFAEHERQVGQTGVTVRPKLYIACGISGAVQHRAGMEQSAKIISINTDPHAPINAIADYTINGTVEEVIPKMIEYYKKNTK